MNTMDNDFYKGQLKRWNEDKGFGFIAAENGKRDVFIHISAFKRLMSRRPINGDMITYQIHTDNEGKSRAVNAKIEGVAETKPRHKPKRVKQQNSRELKRARERGGRKLFANTFSIILLIYLAFFVYNKVTETNKVPNRTEIPIISTPLKQRHIVNYSCDGKVYCSEMTSCEEARYYQKHCPGTRMDGDGDGVPCESQWCGW